VKPLKRSVSLVIEGPDGLLLVRRPDDDDSLPGARAAVAAEAAALADPNVMRALGERSIKRVIYVPDKLVNLVV
jgi:leucyl-tRNA synthetase